MAASIVIDSPTNSSHWGSPYQVGGQYSEGAKVNCVVDYPNGNTYSTALTDVTLNTYTIPFNPAPPTSSGNSVTLTAYLYRSDGTTELAHYSISVVIV
jgi:hypothetical protein